MKVEKTASGKELEAAQGGSFIGDEYRLSVPVGSQVIEAHCRIDIDLLTLAHDPTLLVAQEIASVAFAMGRESCG